MNSGKNRRRTVSKAFEIDQAAQKVFMTWLPNQWIPREDKPEFFLDYTIETTVGGEPTGLRFAVQLKGCESTRLHRYPMKTKHLLYYYEQCQLPVFIFRIMPETKEGYWVFAQKFVREKLNLDVLRKQRTATVRFPSENSLEDRPGFERELELAHKFMRDLRPGSVEAAISAERKALEAREPRLEVAIDFVNGRKHIYLQPKLGETFAFSIQVANKQRVHDAVKAHIESGADLELTSAEFKLLGTSMFDDAAPDSGMQIRVESAQKNPAYTQLVSVHQGQTAVVRIDGVLRHGTKTFSFDGAMKNGPLRLAVQGALSDIAAKSALNIKLGFGLSKWYQSPVLVLPEFDQVAELYEAIAFTGIAEMELVSNDIRILKGKAVNFPKELQEWVITILRWLGRARSVCRTIGINPILRGAEDFCRSNWDAVEETFLHIHKTGENSHSLPIVIRFTTPTEFTKSSSKSPIGTRGPLSVDQGPQDVIIFGVRLRLGSSRRQFSLAEVQSVFPSQGGGTEFEILIPRESEEKIIIHDPPKLL